MNQQEFKSALSVLRSDVRSHAQTMAARHDVFSPSRLAPPRLVVAPLIAAYDWQGLATVTQQMLAGLNSPMAALESEQLRINALMIKLFALKNHFPTYYPKPNKATTWTSLRTNLEAQMANAGISQSRTAQLLDKIGNTGGLKAYNEFKTNFNYLANSLSWVFKRHLEQYMYCYTANHIARFNLAFTANHNLGYPVSARLTSLANGVKLRAGNLFNRVKAKNLQGVVSYATPVMEWVDQKLATDLIPILAHCEQQRQSGTSHFARDGVRALKAADAMRSASFLTAHAKWLAWSAKWHPEVDELSKLLIAANQKSSTANTLHGAVRGIAQVAVTPQTYDEQEIVLEGQIENISIVHFSAAKVLSTARIRNHTGKYVQLVLPHFKIDSGGMVNGCYAAVAGTFKASNPEFNGDPALSLGRDAMSTLASNNWNAWLQYQLRDVFEPVAHNLAIRFSFMPGRNGAINAIKYGTIAATQPSLPRPKGAFI